MSIKISLKKARELINDRCCAFSGLPVGHPQVDPREVLAPGEEILLDTGAKLYRKRGQSKRSSFIVFGYAFDNRDTNQLGIRSW